MWSECYDKSHSDFEADIRFHVASNLPLAWESDALSIETDNLWPQYFSYIHCTYPCLLWVRVFSMQERICSTFIISSFWLTSFRKCSACGKCVKCQPVVSCMQNDSSHAHEQKFWRSFYDYYSVWCTMPMPKISPTHVERNLSKISDEPSISHVRYFLWILINTYHWRCVTSTNSRMCQEYHKVNANLWCHFSTLFWSSIECIRATLYPWVYHTLVFSSTQ